MSRRRASSYALFALGLLGTFSACRSPKDGVGVPGDFRVFAQFGSGESDWIPWTLTIEPDGRATLAYEDDELRKVESIRTLSRADLRDLHARVIDFGLRSPQPALCGARDRRRDACPEGDAQRADSRGGRLRRERRGGPIGREAVPQGLGRGAEEGPAAEQRSNAGTVREGPR